MSAESNYVISSCVGKQSFENILYAQKAAKRRAGRAAYRCRECGLWHVGSQFFRQSKKMKAPKATGGGR